MSKSYPYMGASCCCIFPPQKKSDSVPWEQINLWVNIAFKWKSRVGKKATALPLIIELFHRTIASWCSRQHGLLFSYTKRAYSFILKKKKVVKKLSFGKHMHKRKYGDRSSSSINQLWTRSDTDLHQLSVRL